MVFEEVSAIDTILLAAAVLPPIYLIYRVYRMDTIEKEPIGLLVKLFFLGALSIIPAIWLEQIGDLYVINGIMAGTDSILTLFVQFFIIVAIAEEGCKYLMLKWGSWRHPAFDYVFDGVVYAVVVSLGFALFENIGYVQIYQMQGAVTRAMTAIPGHCIFGIFMGHYYGLAKVAESRGQIAKSAALRRKAVLVPVLLHGFYDFSASIGNDYLAIGFFAYIIALDIIAIRAIREYSRTDTKIDDRLF